ncbi:MAG: sodium-dependent transporter [Kiritimatiellia bacterium]
MDKKRASWSGQLAFILAAAASAIGLGNLWRFPYLAAQYGGGMFILVYLCLVVSLGFTLMVSEIAIGRKTQQSQLTAYSKLHGAWGIVGLAATIIPILITPYYCVIGGWVLYYLKAYALMAFTGATPMGEAAAQSGAFFTGFISAPFSPFAYGMVFVLGCAGVIVLGVKNGIERSNLVMMPILFLMAVAISIYVVCTTWGSGGLEYYLKPNFESLSVNGHFSLAMLAKTILGAMGQMFYSLSLAMGIMITYGSYMKRENSIEGSVRRIEIFDTLIALIAGLMIIPVVYMFAVKTGVTPELIAKHGGDTVAATKEAVHSAMNAGPGLMFITLPKVFATLGTAGTWIGLAFFVLVTFAAATSAISLFEACVASVCDLLHLERKAATFFTTALMLFLATFSALGYGPWGHVKIFGMQFLDFFDFITNSALMPVVAAATCIFIGYVLTPESIVEEVESSGQPMRSKKLYVVMVKYFAPLLVVAILVSEICRALGIGGWKI